MCSYVSLRLQLSTLEKTAVSRCRPGCKNSPSSGWWNFTHLQHVLPMPSLIYLRLKATGAQPDTSSCIRKKGKWIFSAFFFFFLNCRMANMMLASSLAEDNRSANIETRFRLMIVMYDNLRMAGCVWAWLCQHTNFQGHLAGAWWESGTETSETDQKQQLHSWAVSAGGIIHWDARGMKSEEGSQALSSRSSSKFTIIWRLNSKLFLEVSQNKKSKHNGKLSRF